MTMRMQQRFIVLILFVMLFAPLIVSAQDTAPLARFTYSPPSLFDDKDFAYNFLFGSNEVSVQPDIMTGYYPLQSGTQTITFTVSNDDSTADTTTSIEVTLEAGNRYSVIHVGADQPPIVVNETVAEAETELAEGENTLTIVTTSAAAPTPFKVLDNAAPTPRDRALFTYDSYLQSGIGENGVIVQRLDPQTQAVTASLNIPYLPNTDVIINGDRLLDMATPVVMNYSTTLSTADWLAGVNQMPNPPFTFTEFINSAVVGGFDAALAECPNYMWFAWTDTGFAGQSAANQSYISGMGAGTILNNSVREGATTTPWLISPTETRGGTPLFVGDPLAELESSTTVSGAVYGNILMTISTTGNNVQNVIHITDAVPVSEAATAPVENINLYPSRTSLNLVLPLGPSG
jgi:hypothetical protein